MDTTTIILTEEQEQIAARIDDFMASTKQTFLVHGLAGTGKTMLLAHTALQYNHATLCTLTGKAAPSFAARPACRHKPSIVSSTSSWKSQRTRPEDRFSNSNQRIPADS
jgi:hypothetical protein